jgi:phosphoribosylglycinamide formyltransferase-1
VLKIGIMASGRGSNFQSIIDAVERGYIPNAAVALLIVDKPDAYAIERAKNHGIAHKHVNPKDFPDKNAFFVRIAELFKEAGVGLVALAGFMRIVRKPLLDAFPMKVLNIHPAILPSFPGLHGQDQAADYGVRISGCTVHFVDEGMDTGPVIIQAAVPVRPDDTGDSLSERILKFEHKIYPEAIRLFAEGKLEISGRKVMIKDYTPSDDVVVNPPLPQ